MGIVAKFETIRSVVGTSLNVAYQAASVPLVFPASIFRLINTTNADIFLSTNGVNDHIFLAEASFVLYDVSTNRSIPEENLKIPALTQFYARTTGTITAGTLYIEVIYQS